MTEPRLTHVDETGAARMVDVSAKPVTARVATAAGRVLVSPEVVALLRGTGVPKGDAVAVARIAGIAGAKRTPDLVPLCHPIALHGVTVDLEVTDDAVEITATARTADRTGVEMEALTSVAVAGLTMIDMVKAVDPRAVDHRRPPADQVRRQERGLDPMSELPDGARALVVTASNRAAAGVYEDRSGQALAAGLRELGFTVEGPHVRPDDVDELEAVLRERGGPRVRRRPHHGRHRPVPHRRHPGGHPRACSSARPRASPRPSAGTAPRTASRRRCSPAAWPARPAAR